MVTPRCARPGAGVRVVARADDCRRSGRPGGERGHLRGQDQAQDHAGAPRSHLGRGHDNDEAGSVIACV
eukprot:1408653-Rhodomonas_salina.4